MEVNQMKFIWDHLKKSYIKLIFFCILGLVYGLSTFAAQILLATNIPNNLEKAKLLSIWLPLIFSAALSIQFFIRRYVSRFALTISYDICQIYYKRIEATPSIKLNMTHTGYLISLVGRVSGTLSNLIEQCIANFASILIGCIITFYSLFSQSVSIGFGCLVLVSIFLKINFVFSKKQQKHQEIFNKKVSKAWEVLTDFIMNIKTVKRLHVSDYSENKINSVFKDVKSETKVYFNFISKRWFVSDSILVIVFGSSIFATLLQAYQGNEAALSYFVFYVATFPMLNAYLGRLAITIDSFMMFRTHTKQLEDILSESTSMEKTQPNEFEQLKVKKLRFKYNECLNSMYVSEFTIKRGEIVGIIGDSGQGKTTFLNLLTGELQPNTGQIIINGCPNTKLSYVLVSQEVEMFNASLHENLCFGLKSAEEYLWELLTSAGLDNWISKLDSGLETIVGEKGLKLSAGQKQRINLIRGIILDRDIYFLDEPTSQLDPNSEKLVIQMIVKYLAAKGKTVIIVTHGERLRDICSKIYKFKKGELSRIK
jgi:ABC-type multidrug transport system fused ATPase/permease subunit